MIKIDDIKIKGYKNIETADLRLGNFNVIIGPNNSGKSNFVQSISFLNFLINSSNDDVERCFDKGFGATYFKELIPIQINDKIKNINDFTRNGIIEFELTFSNTISNRVFSYFLEIEWEATISINKYKIKNEKLDVKETNRPGPPTIIFKRIYESVKYGVEFSKMDVIEKIPTHLSVLRLLKIISEVKEDYKDAVDSLNEIIKTPIFYFSNIELLKTEKERLNTFNGRTVSFELEQEIIALEESDKWEIFEEASKNILSIEKVFVFKFPVDPKNEKMPSSKSLFFIHNRIGKSLNQFSDGTLLILALITKVLCTKNHLFLIEEPENSTHPKALVDLMDFIKSFSENKQFILTSHSIAILNKTKIEEIIASTIGENGFCELYNITSKRDLKTKLKNSKVNFSDELFFSIDDKNEFD